MKKEKNGRKNGRTNGYSKDAALLLKLLKKGDISFDKASASLDISKDTIAELSEELSSAGYDVKSYVGSDDERYLTLKRSEDIGLEAVSIATNNRTMKIAIIAEIRMGAYQAQISMLHWLYKVFEKEDVDCVIVAGGLTVGLPTPTLQPDIFKGDWRRPRILADYVIKHFPCTKRFKTYVISNRREVASKTKEGINLLSLVAKGRDDISYVGDLEATFRFKSVLLKIMAPWDDNSPKGASYGLQKIVDSVNTDPPPHIIVVGGMHKRSELPDYGEHGIYVYSVPSLHTQMRRQLRKGIRPHLGCLILELNFKKDWSFDFNSGLRAHHFNLDRYAIKNDCLADIKDFETSKLSKQSRRVLEWLVDERIISEGELSRRLNKSKEFIRRLVAGLAKRLKLAIPFSQESKRYEFPDKEKSRFIPLDLKYDDVFKKLTKEGGLACTHFGSNHDMPEIVRLAYQEAAENGVRRMFHAGDVTEGPAASGYRGHQNDVKFSDMDRLEDYTFVKWPKIKIKVDPKRPLIQTNLVVDEDGHPCYEEQLVKEGEGWLQTDIIDGNHDCWAKQSIGHRPVRALAFRMPKLLRYLGPPDGTISMDGAVVFEGVYNRLTHGDGGLGYTISMKMQKHMASHRRRGLSRGLPTVLWFGNWHVAYMLFEDEVGIMLPCFKSEDEFHLRRDLVSWVGMYCVELFEDNNHHLTLVVTNYRNYRDKATMNK